MRTILDNAAQLGRCWQDEPATVTGPLPIDPSGTNVERAMNLDLRYFFDGMQSKEQSASAYLAALLAGSEPFRAQFFAQLEVEPAVDPTTRWEVRVENSETFVGSMDITLDDRGADEQDRGTFVFIENKISPWSKEQRLIEGGPSQLLRYYLGAKGKWADRRVIAVYLAPDLKLGDDEVREVAAAIAELDRSAPGSDAARAVSWAQVSEMVGNLPEGGGWFGTTGIAAVMKAIADPGTPLPPDAQRKVVREITRQAFRVLSEETPDLEMGQWKTKVGEVILVQNAPVTMMLTVRYDVDLDTAQLGRVVTDDGLVHVRVITYLGLPKKRMASPALKAAWGSLLGPGSVQVGTIGRLPSPNGRKIEHLEPWEGTREELRDLLIDRGRQAIGFLRPLAALAREAGNHE